MGFWDWKDKVRYWDWKEESEKFKTLKEADAIKEIETIGKFISSHRKASEKMEKYNTLANIVEAFPQTANKALEIMAGDVSLLPQSKSWFKQMFSKNVIKWKERGDNGSFRGTYFWYFYKSLESIVKSNPESAEKALDIACGGASYDCVRVDKLSETLIEIVKINPQLANKALEATAMSAQHEMNRYLKGEDRHLPMVRCYAYETMEQIISSRPDLAGKVLDVMKGIVDTDKEGAYRETINSLKRIDSANPKLFSEPAIAFRVVEMMEQIRNTKHADDYTFGHMYKDAKSQFLPKCNACLNKNDVKSVDIEQKFRVAHERCADKENKSKENAVNDVKTSKITNINLVSKKSNGKGSR